MSKLIITKVQEEFTAVESLPLWLSFEPDAIRQHFEGIADVDELTDKQLAEIGFAAVQDDILYRAFHEVLRDAVEEIAGFDPDDCD